MMNLFNSFIQSANLIIKPTVKNDFELYCEIFKESNFYLALNKNLDYQNSFLQSRWNDIFNNPNIINFAIYLKNSHQFCGQICFQHIDEEIPEIGIDILSKYQNKGYGFEAVCALSNWYYYNYNVQKIKAKIDKNNAQSKRMFEKLGAKFYQYENIFSQTIIDKFKAINQNDTTDLKNCKNMIYHITLPIEQE